MIQALSGTIIVKPIHRERYGALYIPDIGKPTTYGEVVSSGVEWLHDGDEVLHLPWARLVHHGADRLWEMSTLGVVAHRPGAGQPWQCRPGWLMVEIEQAQEASQGAITLIEQGPGVGEGRIGVAVTGPWAGQRVVWKPSEDRTVTIRYAGREWQVIEQVQLLAVVGGGTSGGIGRPPLPSVVE